MRVVLSSTALLSFMSVRKAAALAIAQLGIAVFFLAGITVPALGPSAVWFAAGALLLAALVRAIDIESWALFIPGGLVGRVRLAFGPRAATIAATASLTERLLLVALASILVGHYASGGDPHGHCRAAAHGTRQTRRRRDGGGRSPDWIRLDPRSSRA